MNSAVFCTLGLLLLIMTWVETTKEELDKTIQDCKKELNYTWDAFTNSPPTNEYNETSKCFVACIFQKEGWLKKDGIFDLESYKTELTTNDPKFPEELKKKLSKVIEECPKEVKIIPDDLCETTYNFLVCQEKKVMDNSTETKKD